MKQSKFMSVVEALTNVIVGYFLALGVQLLVFPWFGINISLQDNLMIGGLFLIQATIRSYVLRRIFEEIRIRTSRPPH